VSFWNLRFPQGAHRHAPQLINEVRDQRLRFFRNYSRRGRFSEARPHLLDFWFRVQDLGFRVWGHHRRRGRFSEARSYLLDFDALDAGDPNGSSMICPTSSVPNRAQHTKL
jgi:hypothetical protein